MDEQYKRHQHNKNTECCAFFLGKWWNISSLILHILIVAFYAKSYYEVVYNPNKNCYVQDSYQLPMFTNYDPVNVSNGDVIS